MRYVVFAVVFGTPAHAHHEVVVATSMMPLMGGLAVIAVAALAGLRERFKRLPKDVADEESKVAR